MRCRIVEMRSKQVINVKTGERIGCVCDVEVDVKDARLIAIVVYGPLKCFGLLGRGEDIIIRWDDIEVIGEDTILVNHNCAPRRKRPRFKWPNNFFRM